MSCFGIPRLVKPRSPAFSSLFGGPSISTYLPSSRRALHAEKATPDDLFDYTSGRWIYNEALRLSERKRVFNVPGLRLLVAQSVGRSPSDILSLTKLAEGGFNRSFLITMHDGFQMVARIPYPYNRPSYHLLASEVATMDYLRTVAGIPIPEVYGYSPGEDNAAETEYIFMEYVRGTTLGAVWTGLAEKDFVSIMRQLVELEAKMMGVEFPAGGSLYYARDLEKVGGEGIQLPDDAQFCIGPDVSGWLWHGRRSRLQVNRGPCAYVASSFRPGAHKELAFLERFGQPLLPFNRWRRELYNYQERLPSDHAENLDRYLLIAPSILPQDPALGSFRIRHPDLTHANNILISRTTDSDEWKICSLIDWQHASILPISLLAGIPGCMECGRSDFDPKTRPSLPDYFAEVEWMRPQMTHYLYLKDTEELNPLHYAALSDPQRELRQHLFEDSSRPWTSETLHLKYSLMQATQKWDALAGPGAGPCPIAFNPEDVTEAERLHKRLDKADFNNSLGRNKAYELALRRLGEMTDDWFSELETEEERANFLAHYEFGDMDEEPYM
ncbi:protein kinase subdomain-containing protein PKL/CAK/Fmp29 [Roridomyces roridus]|uniref:Protein kinase subdomain-containing protein PKL/CAK/Fmp29 n=1 Tax=Roridomyces roridus TaxID=1738132 RepID=A0AAD7AX81_9AGAR|nr:protein kinase subdomain-containing protein PKL/CAK/Fmp29 [Roridomyces roridus]